MPSDESKPAVLVVDDEALIRLTVVDAVEDLGAKPLEAGNVEEAMQVLQEHPEVKVLVTDVDMPGDKNGLQLASDVHEQLPEVGIVVTSGEHHVDEAALPDAASFLSKPYAAEELIDLVASKLDE
jgi:DNA-binding NtrC family response regulator